LAGPASYPGWLGKPENSEFIPESFPAAAYSA
jgi:hypothetical protein